MSSRSRLPLAISAGVLLLILLVPWSHRKISGTANLVPERKVRIEAPDDALIEQVFVREGDPVRKGQPLFRLASLVPIEDVERHRAERERQLKKSSAARGSSNPGLAYQAEQQASSEEVALKSAELRRDYLLVRSPMDGRILTARLQDLPGRYVTAGTELGEIGDTRRMRADIAVSERFLEYLKVGAPVAATIRTTPLKSWKGSIATISSATLEQPKTATGEVVPYARPDRFVVRAVFDNSSGGLLPGAEARVKIASRREGYLIRAWNLVWRWFRSVVW